MPTGIYRAGILSEEEVPQKDIDFWCSICQFPIGKEKCTEKVDIQRCWNEIGVRANAWHLLHECPFHHQDRVCICNDFKNIQEAFAAAGLKYKE